MIYFMGWECSLTAAKADAIPVYADRLDSQEFYELMQRYRHAGIRKASDGKIYGTETDVVAAFEAVKDWIRKEDVP